MNTYTKVYFLDTKRTIILKNPAWKGDFYVGVEVDKGGDEIHTKKFDERKHILQRGTIKKIVNLTWNLKYATLEEDK
jgi:hypothetical protein